ncbi:MAG: hypothetical protein KF799_06865 [Bdellovibrionales bacterium]|nr:hypothetical protein [Bdellovibrionales bacterium]
MFHPSLAVFLFSMLAPCLASAMDYESPATFSRATCEQYLAGRGGRQMVRDAVAWLRDLPTVTFLNPRKVEISGREAPDPSVLNPKIVWFTAKQGEDSEAVRARYEEAKQRSDRYHLDMIRSLPLPTHERVLAEIQHQQMERPLSDTDLSALGIASRMPVTVQELKARLSVQKNKFLQIDMLKGDQVVGGLRLQIARIRPGFQNVIPQWQAAQVSAEDWPNDFRQIRFPEGDEAMLRFLSEHGQLALFRRHRATLFAYVIAAPFLQHRGGEPRGLTIEIFQVRPCGGPEMERSTYVFPAIRPEQSTVCLFDTFLRLQAPYISAIEGVDRPAGWPDRQLQM